MKRIIFTRNEGGVSVIYPDQRLKLESESHDDFILNFLGHIPWDAKDVKIVDDSELPIDRELFRNAWIISNNNITHDINKCLEIQKDKLRAYRKPLLEKLDADFMRALEDSDTNKQEQIKTKKQKLRDITIHPDLNSTLTPEQLNKVWPFEE